MALPLRTELTTWLCSSAMTLLAPNNTNRTATYFNLSAASVHIDLGRDECLIRESGILIDAHRRTSSVVLADTSLEGHLTNRDGSSVSVAGDWDEHTGNGAPSE